MVLKLKDGLGHIYVGRGIVENADGDAWHHQIISLATLREYGIMLKDIIPRRAERVRMDLP